MRMTYDKTSENNLRRRTSLHAATAGQVDHPRFASGRTGAVCRPQQGRQKLADPVALFADCAGEIHVWGREIEPTHRALFLVGRYTGPSARPSFTSESTAAEAPERLILADRKSVASGRGWRNRSNQFHPCIPLMLASSSSTHLQKVRESRPEAAGLYANDYREAGALKEACGQVRHLHSCSMHHLAQAVSAADPLRPDLRLNGSYGRGGYQRGLCIVKRMSQTADNSL